VVVVGVAYRFWALQGPGFRNGTNGAWLHRTIVDLLGPPATHIINRDTLPVAVALLLMALMLAFHPARRRAAALIGGIGMGLLWFASFQASLPITDLLLELSMPEFWGDMCYVSLFLFLVIRFVLGRRRAQWFGYGWAVITHIPLMSMPVGDHGFYLVAIGWSLWLGEALDDVLLTVRQWLPASSRPAAPIPAESP
jgi:hypothetical protein